MSMTISPNTPVLIGVGQSVDRIDAHTYHGWSAADLAGAAARAAIDDAGATIDITAQIGAIATTRTFEDSRAQPAPFGKSTNFPRSVAQRVGIAPRLAVWEKAGGNTPQDLVGEFGDRISAGAFDFVLLAGAEAISTVRNAERNGLALDFAEEPEGDVEDRGAGLEDFQDPLARQHGITVPTLAYGLAETARRARTGLDRDAYAATMGQLFAPFTRVAHDNPWSAWDVPTYSAEELIDVGPHNRWIGDPFCLRLVARDQVNLGAAVLLSSYGAACAAGIAEDRMVFLNGFAKAEEKGLLARPDIGDSPASRRVCELAVARAGLTVADIARFDFYSCYPVAVSNAALDGLGLSANDPRGLTLTGGLPFFGGPGNNYSMHAIVEAVHAARADPGASIFVGANGGYLSKYSAGVYSTNATPWENFDAATVQTELDAITDVAPLAAYDGPATIETYTVHHDRSGPAYAVVVGRTDAGERIIARSIDAATAGKAHQDDVLGQGVHISHADGVNSFRF